MLAAQAIQCGDARAVVAGGTENMSAAPYLLPKARGGYRLGHGEVLDAVIKDGLWDVYNNLHMGTCGDRCAAHEGISRQEQDDFAVASFQRAIKAQNEKRFADELVSVEIKGRKGSVFVSEDETPGRFNEEKLRALRPAFDPAGSVTAGNASSINDAAAAIVVISPERAKTLGVQPQAKILGYATYSREPEWFTLAPVCAIDHLMQKLGLSVAGVDLFEVNEAFSVVTIAAMKQLNIPHEKMNVHGGAVALGHPIGASGTRILVTLLSALKQRQAKVGIASLCIGGGEAVAMACGKVLSIVDCANAQQSMRHATIGGYTIRNTISSLKIWCLDLFARTVTMKGSFTGCAGALRWKTSRRDRSRCGCNCGGIRTAAITTPRGASI